MFLIGAIGGEGSAFPGWTTHTSGAATNLNLRVPHRVVVTRGAFDSSAPLLLLLVGALLVRFLHPDVRTLHPDGFYRGF
jgi:hypothetical protein